MHLWNSWLYFLDNDNPEHQEAASPPNGPGTGEFKFYIVYKTGIGAKCNINWPVNLWGGTVLNAGVTLLLAFPQWTVSTSSEHWDSTIDKIQLILILGGLKIMAVYTFWCRWQKWEFCIYAVVLFYRSWNLLWDVSGIQDHWNRRRMAQTEFIKDTTRTSHASYMCIITTAVIVLAIVSVIFFLIYLPLLILLERQI